MIIIIGISRIAMRLAHDSANKGKKVVVISEHGEDTLSDELVSKGITVLHKKHINEKVLISAGINHASSCLVVSDDDEYNITISDFISKMKKRKGAKNPLNLIVHVENWYTRNLLIDQISSFNSTPNLAIRFFDIHQSVAKLIYDQFPPHQYVNDETKTNNERVICILGNNEI
ncbi:NAD-binding protein, partial [Vicingaceae bacterium]|nr:NAD-binding protein [Vicingaceae bacterium]